VGLRGLSRLTCVCVFQSDLSTPIKVSLIVVPNSIYGGAFFFALHKIPVFITGTISKVVTTMVLYIVSCNLMRLLFFRNK